MELPETKKERPNFLWRPLFHPRFFSGGLRVWWALSVRTTVNRSPCREGASISIDTTTIIRHILLLYLQSMVGSTVIPDFLFPLTPLTRVLIHQGPQSFLDETDLTLLELTDMSHSIASFKNNSLQRMCLGDPVVFWVTAFDYELVIAILLARVWLLCTLSIDFDGWLLSGLLLWLSEPLPLYLANFFESLLNIELSVIGSLPALY